MKVYERFGAGFISLRDATWENLAAVPGLTDDARELLAEICCARNVIELNEMAGWERWFPVCP